MTSSNSEGPDDGTTPEDSPTPSFRPLVSLLDDCIIEELDNGDYVVFNSSGIGTICQVFDGLLGVDPRQIATLFVLSGKLLNTVSNVIRHHDAGTLAHTSDSANIEHLRGLCEKVEKFGDGSQKE